MATVSSESLLHGSSGSPLIGGETLLTTHMLLFMSTLSLGRSSSENDAIRREWFTRARLYAAGLAPSDRGSSTCAITDATLCSSTERREATMTITKVGYMA